MEVVAMNGRMHWRQLASLVLVVCVLGLGFSGVVLYFAPPCSVARAVGWKVMGMDKDAWEGLHICLGLLMLAAAGLHIFYNFQVLVAYLGRHKREALVAAVVGVCAIVWAWAGLWPIGSIVSYQDRMKEQWKVTVGVGGSLGGGELRWRGRGPR